MSGPAHPRPSSESAATGVDAQVDALLAALGPEAAGALLGELDAAHPTPAAASAREIRARVADLAKARPEFIAKIITSWINESRTKGR